MFFSPSFCDLKKRLSMDPLLYALMPHLYSSVSVLWETELSFPRTGLTNNNSDLTIQSHVFSEWYSIVWNSDAYWCWHKCYRNCDDSTAASVPTSPEWICCHWLFCRCSWIHNPATNVNTQYFAVLSCCPCRKQAYSRMAASTMTEPSKPSGCDMHHWPS